MTSKILSLEDTKHPRVHECILYVCLTTRLSMHVLTSIASVTNALYIIELLYNSTVSMVTDATLLI